MRKVNGGPKNDEGMEKGNVYIVQWKTIARKKVIAVSKN